MKSKKILFGLLTLILAVALSACASNNEGEDSTKNDDSMGGMDHSSMNDSGEVSEDLKVAENPTYEVGTKVSITEGHMEGMEGAEATIVGAYDTTAYAISYDPTTGGEKVEDHKWVIHEEIPDAGEEPFKLGDKITINAAHMEGMDGVTAEITKAEATTVYMIDFTPTTGGEKMKNHKWVTESELSPAK